MGYEYLSRGSGFQTQSITVTVTGTFKLAAQHDYYALDTVTQASTFKFRVSVPASHAPTHSQIDVQV